MLDERLSRCVEVGQDIGLPLRIPGSTRPTHLTGRNLCTRSPENTRSREFEKQQRNSYR